MNERYLSANEANWDERVGVHFASEFYDVESFRKGRITLRDFEIEEVGPVEDLDLLHLQCHFGLDTLSWARLGARVTGVDFSSRAIAQAEALAAETGIAARFVNASVNALPTDLRESFDIVYTSHGVLCWLPDLAVWAENVARSLRSGGRFYLSEFHPWCDAFAWDTPADALRPEWSYFDREPHRDESSATYTDGVGLLSSVTYQWQHTLGDVISELIRVGLRIEFLRERPFSLYQQFSFLERRGDGWWSPGVELPLMFSLRATKG